MSGTMINSPKGKRNDQHDNLLASMQAPKLVASLLKVLPKNLTPDRFVRQAVTLVRKNPDLLECDPFSVIGGMIQAAELGMELSGVLGHCFLIKRWNNRRKCNEATFQMGYKGYRELAYRSGRVLSIQPRVVYAGDEFEVHYGSRPYIEHRPGNATTLEAVAFYCVALTTAGSALPDFEAMTAERVRTWRQKYSPPPKDKADYSAWATNFEGMALKTVTGILCRRLPLSVEGQAALAAEDVRPEEALTFSPTTLEILSSADVESGEEDTGGAEPAPGVGGGEAVAQLPPQAKA